MAKVFLVHCIFPHKVPARELPRVVADIGQYERLAANYGYHGHGVYAFYSGRLPVTHRHYPAVVFEIDEEMVNPVGPKAEPFAFIRVPFNQSYLIIEVKEFLNLP